MRLLKIDIPSDKTANFLSQFLLLDAGLALLPIGIIAVLQHATDSFTEKFWLLQDWSFAAIVIMGLALARSLELKIIHQKDLSERGLALALLCAFGLIGAVLSFSLAQLHESGVAIDESIRKSIQFGVIGFGLFILGVSHLAKSAGENGLFIKELEFQSKQRTRKHLRRTATEAAETLKELEVTLHQNSEIFNTNNEIIKFDRIDLEEDLRVFTWQIEYLSDSVNRLQDQLKNMSSQHRSS